MMMMILIMILISLFMSVTSGWSSFCYAAMARPFSLSVSDGIGTQTVPIFKNETEYIRIVNGSSLAVNASPNSTTVRIYIHSDCTDAHIERQELWKNVYPTVRLYAQSLGLHLHLIDPYHMIDCNQTIPFIFENKEIYQLNLKEICTSQELSAGTSFMTFLGQKYGHRSIQLRIDATEFELLLSGIEDPSSNTLLKDYYKLDRGTLPLQYILKKPLDITIADWTKMHDILSKIIWKAAKVAFGKDPGKAQNYIISVTENEIIQGIFNCPKNINTSCVWFKRTFTDLFDQRPSTDQSLCYYSDITMGRRGLEFDSESVKLLNYLKEARMPAKYTGLDPENIFDFLIKWHKNKGLTLENNGEHDSYMTQLCDEVTKYLKQSLDTVSDNIKSNTAHNSVYQECLLHLKHCKQLLVGIKERSVLIDKVLTYLKNPSLHSIPLVIAGEAGCGKSTLIAAVVQILLEGDGNKCNIMRFIRVTPSSRNIRTLIKSINQQIMIAYDYNNELPTDYRSVLKSFNHLISTCPSADKPLYIFLDGVDQFDKEYEALGLSWLPIRLPSNVCLIISTSSEAEYRCYPLLKSILKNNNSFINIPLLTLDQAESFLQYFLEQHNLRITPVHLFMLSDSFKKCNPISLVYLKVIATLSTINSIQLSSNSAVNINVAMDLFLQYLENIHGRQFVSTTLGLITASYYGMSEEELLDILTCNKEALTEIQSNYEREFPLLSCPIKQVPTFAWTRFLYGVYPSLLCYRMAEGGVWVLQWKNRILLEIATRRYLSTDNDKQITSAIIADYFSGKMVTMHKPTDQSKTFNESIPEQIIDMPSCPESKSPHPESQSPHPESQSPICDNEAIRIINHQEMLASNSRGVLFNKRRMTELPTAIYNANQHNALVRMIFDYHTLKAYIVTGLIDHILNNIAFLFNPINIGGHYENSLLRSEARLLHDSIILMVNNLTNNPTQLSVELIGRLLPHGMNATQESNINNLLRQAIGYDLTCLTPVHIFSNLSQENHLLTMSGHVGPITAIDSTVVIHNNESHAMVIMSSSEDCTLRSWDWQGSGTLKAFNGHTDSVLCVAVSKNGQYVSSGSNDCTVRYWSVNNANCIHVMVGHKKAVTGVAITKACDKVMSCSLDSTVKVWNTDQSSSCKGQLVFTLIPSRAISSSARVSVNSLCLCKEDTELLCGLENGCVVISNIVAGEILKYIKLSSTVSKPVVSIAVAQVKERRVIISVSDGYTHINHYNDGNHIDSYPYNIPLYGKLATTDINRVVDRLPELFNDNTNLTAFNFADLGAIGITGTKEGTLSIWDMTIVKHKTRQVSIHTDAINSITYSPSADCIATSSNNRVTPVISIWKIDDLIQPMAVMENIPSSLNCILFYSNSNQLFSGHSDGIVRLWNIDTLRVEEEYCCMGQLNGYIPFGGVSNDIVDTSVTCLAVSNDNKVLMVGLDNGDVIGWSIAKKTHKVLDKHHAMPIISVIFSPPTSSPNKYLITADKSGTTVVRDYRTLNIVTTDDIDKEVELCCVGVGLDSSHLTILTRAYNDGIILVSSLPDLKQLYIIQSGYVNTTSMNYYNDKLITTAICNNNKNGCVLVWTKETCIDKVICDSGITSVAMTTINGHSVIMYGCIDGYIGSLLYNSPNSGNENMLLGLLTHSPSQLSQHAPHHHNTLSEISKSKISQTTLQSVQEKQEAEQEEEIQIKETTPTQPDTEDQPTINPRKEQPLITNEEIISNGSVSDTERKAPSSSCVVL